MRGGSSEGQGDFSSSTNLIHSFREGKSLSQDDSGGVGIFRFILSFFFGLDSFRGVFTEGPDVRQKSLPGGEDEVRGVEMCPGVGSGRN